MKKLILTYGTFAGIIVSAMLVFSFTGGATLNFEYGELLGYATMIIALSSIFFAIKYLRDKQLNGFIGFGTAFKIGLGISLVATIIYIVSWMIISNTIAKDFMSEYYQHSVEKLNASNLSASEIKEKIEEMKNFQEMYKNPLIKIGITFLEIFPVGFIISFISALILKRKGGQFS